MCNIILPILLLSFNIVTTSTSAEGIDVKFRVGDLGDVTGVIQSTEWSNRSVYSFLGIPYAEPPIGNLRYKPPVKIESWNGTLDGTSYGSPCPQSSVVYSEDCLTLNVFVPKRENYFFDVNETTLLPVMIFIHGGTFRTGQASLYPPLRFLDTKDLILVVPQYRLGFLGLFSMDTDDVPGNVQFLDQIMAMEWVRDNIAYFGGDKSRVTLYGHSSGSASVHFHLLSPLTEGLFHRTILQSGSALRTYGIDDNPRKSASIMADYCGCDGEKKSEDIANCMRKISVEDIVNCTTGYLDERIYEGLTRAVGHMAIVQTAGERKFLTDYPRELLRRGEFRKLPMIGGVTKDDGSIYLKQIYDKILLPNGWANDTEYAKNNLTGYVLKYLGIRDLTGSIEDAMIRRYLPGIELGDLSTMGQGLIDICTVVSYKSGSYETLRANAAHRDTYAYTFDYEVYQPDTSSAVYPFESGSSHGDDTKLLFPREDYQRNVDIEMAKILVELWTSFVIDGAPKADGLAWPVMSTPVGPYLVIDTETSVRYNFPDEFVTGGGADGGLSSLGNAPRALLIAILVIGGEFYR